MNDEIDYRALLVDGLANLPQKAFDAVAGHVREPNKIAVGDWIRYDAEANEVCGCLMANGYAKVIADPELEGAYDDRDVVRKLGEHFGATLLDYEVRAVAENFDHWAKGDYKSFIDFIRPGQTKHDELLAIVDAAEAQRGD